jgi:hypothetical protein
VVERADGLRAGARLTDLLERAAVERSALLDDGDVAGIDAVEAEQPRAACDDEETEDDDEQNAEHGGPGLSPLILYE